MWLKKNYSSFFKDLQTKPFELQVWFVVTALAGLRTLKSVVQDVTGSKINTTGLIIDLSILMIFCGLCLLIYFKKIPRIPLIVGVILLILLIFSYVQFGGVLGTTEYNLMGLGVLFALAYNRKELAFIMILYLVSILVANLDLRFNGWLTRSFFKGNSTSLDNYLTTLLTVLLIILYFKKALILESSRIIELRQKLNEQIKTIGRQKKELEEKKQFLSKVNARLEEEIRNHSDQIVRQNRAIQDYIWLSTESLQMPLQRISTSVTELSENGILETKLKEQIGELNVVVDNLKRDLIQHQSTYR
jgi:glucan phosphoethanolaminetransferase (alkaline phosphatase superfamily)